MSAGRIIAGAARAARIAARVHAPGSSIGQTTGKVVRNLVTGSHPIIGSMAGRRIEAATASAVDKGVTWAKKPENQARIRQVGAKAATLTGRGIGHMMTGYTSARGSSGNKSGEFDWNAPSTGSGSTQQFI
jgi:hypothetical protein